MSFLVLTPEARERAHAVALHAARPENWYDLRTAPVSRWCPGDDPAHVLVLDSFRCVFSFTVDATGILWRHLSISLAAGRAGKLPEPVAAFTIASWFGFTGGSLGPGEVILAAGPDWNLNVQERPIPNIVLAQNIGPSFTHWIGPRPERVSP